MRKRKYKTCRLRAEIDINTAMIRAEIRLTMPVKGENRYEIDKQKVQRSTRPLEREYVI